MKGLWLQAGCAAVFSLMGIFYEIKRKEQEEVDQDDEEDDKKQISEEHAELEKSRLLLMELSQSVKTHFLKEGVLTKSSFLNFCRQATKSLSEKQVLQLYNVNRRARRPYFPQLRLSKSSNQQYFKFVCLFDNQIQCLIEKCQKDLAVFLNMDYQIISQTIEYFLNEDQHRFRPELSQLTVELRQAIRKKLPSKNKLNEQTVKEIIMFKNEILNEDTQKILSIIRSLELDEQDDQNFIPSFICLYVEDKVYEKFQVEEEDLVEAHKLLNIKESRQLSNTFRKTQNTLMKKIFQST